MRLDGRHAFFMYWLGITLGLSGGLLGTDVVVPLMAVSALITALLAASARWKVVKR